MGLAVASNRSKFVHYLVEKPKSELFSERKNDGPKQKNKFKYFTLCCGAAATAVNKFKSVVCSVRAGFTRQDVEIAFKYAERKQQIKSV